MLQYPHKKSLNNNVILCVMKMSPYERVLHECLEYANESPYRPGKDIREWTGIIVRARTKAAVTVTVTSLVKKCVDPAQDIRRHRVEIPGGYSGHELDSKIVTPFLKANGFPAVSESGWVRRPFNQNAPYGLSYAGSIGGNGLKEAFLRVLDAVESGKADPRSLLIYMLKQLVKLRELERVRLARPTGLTIPGIARRLDSHFSGVGSGKARLPILAVYAAYRQMVGSGTGRYRRMNLREMESPAMAGSRLGSIGDIEVTDPKDGSVVEAVDIKHGRSITADTVRKAYGRFKAEPVKRYYLLTTAGIVNAGEVAREVDRIREEHGCQVIVGDVSDILGRHLQMLKSPDDFIAGYVGLVEDDISIKYAHKMSWNNVVSTMR